MPDGSSLFPSIILYIYVSFFSDLYQLAQEDFVHVDLFFSLYKNCSPNSFFLSSIDFHKLMFFVLFWRLSYIFSCLPCVCCQTSFGICWQPQSVNYVVQYFKGLLISLLLTALYCFNGIKGSLCYYYTNFIILSYPWSYIIVSITQYYYSIISFILSMYMYYYCNIHFIVLLNPNPCSYINICMT